MAVYHCPLCEQEVSAERYEKITGIWREKEKKLAVLKKKEEQLIQREKRMQTKFEIERKKIIAKEQAKLNKEVTDQKRAFQLELNKIKEGSKRKNETMQKALERKLAIETNRLSKREEMAKEKMKSDFQVALNREKGIFKKAQEAIKKEREAIIKEKESAKKEFERKLAIETNRILIKQKKDQKELEKKLKEEFTSKSKLTMDREKNRLQKEKLSLKRHERLQMDKYRNLNQQYVSLQSKRTKDLERSNKKIKLLEEQVSKNKTPQVLGLLEEGIFLEKLKQMFPGDKFEHPGKGGDIIHYILEKGNNVGIIVYELKKVATFNAKHITQAQEAKQDRNADYGILVTNAKRPKDNFGFSVSKGVIIIHPAGALVLVAILRDHLVRISKLKLSKEKRNQTVKAVLDYIQSPSFRNGIETIINDTKDLYNTLGKEVKDHVRTWEFRLMKYRNIYGEASKIETKAVRLLVDKGERKHLPMEEEITAIALPSKID